MGTDAWPHAPTHRLTEGGVYMVTSGTYRKAYLFRDSARLNMLQAALLTIAEEHLWQLEAWSVFTNHYHFIAHAPNQADTLVAFLKELHSRTARALNQADGTPGRSVWHNYWETQLTNERAYFARLHYVHQNPVKHGVSVDAQQYPWCSARRFEALAPQARVKTVYSFPIDRVKVNGLTADLSALAEGDRQAIAKLLQAGEIMDALFWRQTWGDRQALLDGITDTAIRRFVEINYGPWDRLDNDKPFVEGIGPRPPGARFYPEDMTKEEFEAADLPGKDSLYTLLRRDDAGKLTVVPYHVAYKAELEQAAALLRQAAELATDASFANYLKLRADALLSGDYQASDMAWMDMKTSPIDVVIGPIESYQDALFGTKAAFEAFVLVKDIAWSERLAKFAQHLPALQRGLPVPAKYRAERPGTDADLNAYFAIYYGGDANSGAKTIAINLPNDEEVQLAKGSRRLQLENTMRAKFDTILVPIANELIAQDQIANIQFDAFFENVMFHEVAHGLGIKNTLDGKGTVRQALSDLASSYEEGKADILGLYMIGKLGEMGELDAAKRNDNYVTFLAGIFRSVRFGASSAHGQANMVAFNYLQKEGAFTRDAGTGRYRVDFARMEAAVDALSAKILTLQGDGDHAGAQAFQAEYGQVGADLQADLDTLQEKSIPVDIVLKQGRRVLGL